MKTALLTASTGECLTLEEIKDHLRIEYGETADDVLLKGLRTAAMQRIETITNRKLLTQSWYVYHNEWPSGDNYDHFNIPYPPLQSIPSSGLRYTKSTGGSTTFSSTKWDSDIVSEPGRLVLDYNDEWPTETLHNNNPIRIQFVCGYGTKSSEMPESLKLAMKILIEHWYENREPFLIGQTISAIPETVEALISDYRVHSF